MGNFADDLDAIYQADRAAAQPRGGSPAAFAESIYPAVAPVAERLGVEPSVLIAQLGLETAWGRHVIPGTNNYGNVKDFNGGGIAATDSMTGSRDKYRAYASPEEGLNDYANLIEKKYPNAIGSGGDAERFATALKAGGYAEDRNYVRKIVDAHKLVSGVSGGGGGGGPVSEFERQLNDI